MKSVHVFLAAAAAAIYGLVHVMMHAGWLGGRFSTLTPLFSTFLSLSLAFFELCCVEPVSVYLLSENRGEAVLRAPSTVIEDSIDVGRRELSSRGQMPFLLPGSFVAPRCSFDMLLWLRRL